MVFLQSRDAERDQSVCQPIELYIPIIINVQSVREEKKAKLNSIFSFLFTLRADVVPHFVVNFEDNNAMRIDWQIPPTSH